MTECYQTAGINMLQHGQMVHDYYCDLYDHIHNDLPLRHSWRMPDWINDSGLWSRVFPMETVRPYQVYHDCGKPACRTVDEEGRQHFPNHARESERVWRGVGGCPIVGRLIAEDMDVHELKHVGVKEFAQRPTGATLLVTALCEVHANAEMFGGLDSTSFKIKWKNVNKRGNAILEEWKNGTD